MRGFFQAFQHKAHKAYGKDSQFYSKAPVKPVSRVAGLSPAEYDKHLDVIINRLAESPPAVDALAFVLKKIIGNPKDMKFRQVSLNNKIFQQTVGTNERWGVRLLEAVGFTQNTTGDSLNLQKMNLDLNKLKLAAMKLNKAKSTGVYLLAKDKIDFAKEVDAFLIDESAEETQAKARYLEKLPHEPKQGAAGSTKIRVYFGSGDISRMFSSDNTLQAVLDWIGASFNSKVLGNLRSGEFELVDRTVYPPKLLTLSRESEKFSQDEEGSHLDLVGLLDDLHEKIESKTLQTLGLWPSGELDVQKSGFHNRERALNGGPKVESV